MGMMMELQKKIELLLEMAGSTSNYEELMEELGDLEKEIEEKKSQVKEVKKSMKDSKYTKENDRIIDENIKIGLESKKQVYQQEYDTVSKKIQKSSAEEEELHQSIQFTQSRIQSLQSLIETLQNKMKLVHKDSTLSSFYEKILEQTTSEIEELERKKELLNANYGMVQERLEFLGNKKMDLSNQLHHIEERLSDTLIALSTPNFYVDTLLKKKDEQEVDHLSAELEALEADRNHLLEDPVYLAHEATRFLKANDFTATLAWIKKLVDFIKLKPYMTSDASQLNELLEQAISARDEFANEMEHNTYMGKEEGLLDQRVQYLSKRMDHLNEEARMIQEKIGDIDQVQVIRILESLSEAESLYTRLKEEYDEYQKVLFIDDDDKSPRKKSSLQAAYRRKKEELDVVHNVLLSYQRELEETIFESEHLEKESLKEIQEKIALLQEEIQTIQAMQENRTRVKDILAMEKDKATLKQLSDDVEAIRHRQKYKKSADDLYDEFEMTLFSSFSSTDDSKKESSSESDFVDLSDFRIEPSEDHEEESGGFIQTESKEETQELEPFFPEVNSEEPKVFPPRKNNASLEPEKLKVIQVEPLLSKEDDVSVFEEKEDEKPEEPKEEIDFSILGSDLHIPSEEEYISFNDLILGGTKDEN